MTTTRTTPVAPTDRVSEVLARDETLVDVFVRHAPHFEKLRNAAMRRVMARLVTVEQAARMADVPVDSLLRDLNAALHIESGHAAVATPASPGSRAAESSSHRPSSLREIELDLREEMRAGREPFSRIMTAVAALEASEVLLLRTIFEPVPLFALMAKRGFQHEVARHSAEDWSIWFWRGEGDLAERETALRGVEQTAPATSANTDNDAGARDAEAVEPPTVLLDVRGLEPPEPLVRTLAALETLPPGHQLVQLNVRVPQLLLPLLAERGFACEVDDSEVDRVRVRIWRPAPQ